MHRQGMISIWFFIGTLLLIYGVLILGAGVWELGHPPGQAVVHAELHAGIWWGGLLILIGGFYAMRFRPNRG